MARFVPVNPSVSTRGIARLSHPRRSFGKPTAVGALLYVLATVGTPVFHAALRLRDAVAAWARRQHERAEDRKYWELALSDPRVMADLVALQQHADR